MTKRLKEMTERAQTRGLRLGRARTTKLYLETVLPAFSMLGISEGRVTIFGSTEHAERLPTARSHL
jgi:hypothetical protein